MHVPELNTAVALPPAQPKMRTGESFCPGVLHAVAAKDGLLVRIRVPGGLLESAQLLALAHLARRVGDGSLEITSRANLQLRALQPADIAEVADTLRSAGMLPSDTHERIRNISTSPLAGTALAPERLDPRPLVRALDEALCADPSLAGLHAKFSFGIYGSRLRFSPEVEDLAVDAIQAEGSTAMRVCAAGTPLGVVAVESAVACMLDLARACLRVAGEHHVDARARAVVALPGGLDLLRDAIQPSLLPIDPPDATEDVAPVPVGVFSASSGRKILAPVVPLGRITAAQAESVAIAAAIHAADLRLTPWRGLLLADVPAESCDAVRHILEAAGLSLAGTNGFHGLAACAGISGCNAALTDVRADGLALARELASQRPISGWSANLSGCSKQCGRRRGATADLIAEPEGYTVRWKGETIARASTAAAAISAIVQRRATLPSQEAAR